MQVLATLRALGRRILSGWVYPLAAWLDTWLQILSNQVTDPDLWGRLSVAALYFRTGRFPYHDVFSYTAPRARWVDHEWLTGFVFYGLITQFGESALVLFQAGMVLIVLGLIFSLHRRAYQASALYGFYGSLLLAPLYGRAFYPMVRSHIFSLVGFMGFLLLLERVRLGQLPPYWLGLLPILLALWGNLHGGVAMGFLLVACYGLGAVLQQRNNWSAAVPYGAVLLGGVVLLAIFNPYGFSYWAFLLAAWTWDRSRIQEWDPLPLGSGLFVEQQVLVVGVLLLVFTGLIELSAKRETRDKRAPILVLLLLVVMTLKSARLQSFLSLALLAYLPLFLTKGTLEDWARLLTRRQLDVTGPLYLFESKTLKYWLPCAILLGTLTGLTFLGVQRNLLTVPVNDELSQGTGLIRYPIAALEYLKQSPYQGNLLVRFGLGEFAYWQLYPRFKVSMDGRYEEVYSQAQFLANDAFFDRQNTQRACQAAAHAHQTAADFILIEANMPNLATLEQSGQWQQLYGDSYFRVYARKVLAPFVPPAPIITSQVLTIGNFVTPEALQRFARQ